MSKRKTISEDGKTYKILAVLSEDDKAIAYLAECEGDTCVLALPKESKSRAKKDKTAKPAEKKPTLSQLDENTLVHYASSNPYTGSDDTLHVDFDCPRLAGAWCVFRQPLFEAKEQTDRKWKLCPHCAGVPPMLFSPPKSKGLFAPNFHLTVMDESQKKKARKQRGF